MSPDIEKLFFEQWSQFFRHKDASMKSLLAVGFSCEDGWRTLLWQLFSDIEQALRDESDTTVIRDFEIVQVKQKFGTLRVYTKNSTPSIDALIQAATLRSRQTCELCGQPGVLFIDGGWWVARCDACATTEGINPPFDDDGTPQGRQVLGSGGALGDQRDAP